MTTRKAAGNGLFKDTHLVKLELLSNATTIDRSLNYIRIFPCDSIPFIGPVGLEEELNNQTTGGPRNKQQEQQQKKHLLLDSTSDAATKITIAN